MNRTYARLALSLAIALSVTALAQTSRAAASPAAPAPSVQPMKVGVIDIQTAIIASNEGQRDFEALQKRFDPKNSELKTRNDEIEGMKKQLQAQGDKMNDDARAGLIRQIESKQTALKRFVEDTQADLNSQQSELARSIGQKMYKTLVKYAQDNGYAVVIDAGNNQGNSVLWAAQNANITKEVVDAYNVESGVPAQPKSAAPAAPSASKPAAKPAPSTTTPNKPR